MNRPLAKAAAEARARRVAYRTRGYSHRPITRLVSPSDVGELIKPFVFLDYFDIDSKHTSAIGFHPHSGIATLTLLLEGRLCYEETSGTKGIIEPGGAEWMRAAGGAWHTGGVVGTARAKGYQLWIALAPELEGIEPEAQYLGGEHFQSQGPARVILGRHGEAAIKVRAPTTINYFDVALKKGKKWRYQPPDDHTVAWVALHEGRLGYAGSYARVPCKSGTSKMRGPTSMALTHEELRELNRRVKSSTGRRLLWEIYDLRRVVVQADLLALRVRQISIDNGASAQIVAEELPKMLSNLPWLEEERRDRIGWR